MYAIETKNLSFHYQKIPILENINLMIPAASIYGYLGKNGAGKSTTIKLLLGLLHSSKNTIYYDGLEFNANRNHILNKIGSLVESPAYYGNLTGYENLLYLKNIYRSTDQNIVEVLSKVNLLSDKDKKVKKYSSGMKQRLGIAMAMLNNPDILILDEPLNGLDPEGVFEIRELIIKLKEDGKTILLSSHILSEIEKVCTHIGVLQHGSLCYQGTLKKLIDTTRNKITIHSEDIVKIKELCFVLDIEINEIGSNFISIIINKNDRDEFMKKLEESKIRIQNLDSLQNGLEEIYLNLTKQL